jgi:hypothetical protein
MARNAVSREGEQCFADIFIVGLQNYKMNALFVRLCIAVLADAVNAPSTTADAGDPCGSPALQDLA